MKKCIVIALLVVSSVFAQAQVVMDGSFDEPGFGTHQNGHLGDPVYFSTNYTWKQNSPGNNTGSSQYTVATQARPWNSFGTNIYGDHTTGTGNYLILNGSSVFNAVVWQQSVSGFTIGQEYEFSGWSINWSGGVPGKMDVYVTGYASPTSVTTSATAGVWEMFSKTFVATSSSHYFTIVSTETASGGNDFGLDDLSVQSVPEPATLYGLGILGAALIRKRKSNTENAPIL
jgi:hypothetical protein